MTTTKNVSKDGYAWGHFGVILFHTIIATLLIFIIINQLFQPKGLTLILMIINYI